MNNIDLTLQIENLIKYELLNNPDIQYLQLSHSKLIAQIISNYNLIPSTETFPSAEMILLGAPTGAGKDTLVRKIMADNSDKNYIALNMDMFRHYHSQISTSQESISDKEFAKKTNQTSYELYYIIQEIILKLFPGTNVIVTGTIRDLEWVKNIINRYKHDKKTNYKISLVTLAVPIKESAFSIFERYLNMVNTRSSSNTPLRYTDLPYHDDTVNQFISNVRFFEDDLHSNKDSLVDSIKVYRRSKDLFNLSEDNIIYDSTNPNSTKCAVAHIYEIMYSKVNIKPERIDKLLNIIKNNSDYLKSQDLYRSILTDLGSILPLFNKNSQDIFK